MIARLFAPRTPAEELARERAQVADRKPHLALVGKDRRPDPTMYCWFSVEEMVERERGR